MQAGRGIGGGHLPPQESGRGRGVPPRENTMGRGRGSPPTDSQRQAVEVNNYLRSQGASSIVFRTVAPGAPVGNSVSVGNAAGSTTVQPVHATAPSSSTVQSISQRTSSSATVQPVARVSTSSYSSASSTPTGLTPAAFLAMLAASSQTPSIDLSGSGRTVQPISSSSSSTTASGGTVTPAPKGPSGHLPPRESSRK